MSDEIDITNDHVMLTTEAGMAQVRRAAAAIPKGRAGICIKCGERSARLVARCCAPCRDRALIGYAKK